MEYTFEALKTKDIYKIVKKIAESNNHSVIITLINGDILLGDLNLDMKHFDSPPHEEEWWVARKDLGGYLSVKLQPKGLYFNTEEGRKYSDSLMIKLKNNLISDIQHLNWKDLEPVRWMPNPFAKMIFKNNVKVAKNWGLTIETYYEGGFSEKKLPPDGIKFTNEQLIYVDWDFMSKLSGGFCVSASRGGISAKFTRNAFKFALDKIKDGTIEKIQHYLPGSFPFEEGRISGYLVIPPEEINTEMEDEECMVALCCKEKTFNRKKPYVPLLLKKKSFRYPKEYLPYINSEIVFYGEVVEIPIYEQGISSEASLMVRGIAYCINK